MPVAEIITIGTEILLGDIVDTNAPYIARALRDAGVDLYRKTTVGDNAHRIAQAIQQALERADLVITSGGLGPTVDDPTREAVALAAGVELEFRQELWEQIQARFQRYGRPPTENNRRQAYVPRGAIAIENPVGTAPAFIVTIASQDRTQYIFSLPGVPREMEYLLDQAVLPYLRQQGLLHGIIKTRVLHTAGVGESMIDERIGDLEELSNPTVGLAAHSGQVDVRVTAKAETEAQAGEMIAGIEQELIKRLGNWIYGTDGQTLENIALQNLARRGWKLAVVEAGLGGELTGKLSTEGGPFAGGQVLAPLEDISELPGLTRAYRELTGAEAAIGVALVPGTEKSIAYFTIITPSGEQEITRSYGGPPGYALRWGLNYSLDTIRNLT